MFDILFQLQLFKEAKIMENIIKDFEGMESRDRLTLVMKLLDSLEPDERFVFQTNVILNPDGVKFCNGCPRLVMESSDGDGESGQCTKCKKVMCKFCGGVRFVGFRSVIVMKDGATTSFIPQENGMWFCKSCHEEHRNCVATQ